MNDNDWKVLACRHKLSGSGIVLGDNRIVKKCSQKSGVLEIPDGAKYISKTACYKGNCSEVIIPDSVIAIGSRCFAGCRNLKSVRLSSLIEELPQSCFGYCDSLSDLVNFEQVLELDINCFRGTAISSIDCFKNIKSIGSSCFSDCTNIRSLKFPKSLQFLDTYAFSCCTELQFIDFSNIQCGITLGSGVFEGCKEDCKLIIPSHLKEELTPARLGFEPKNVEYV